MAGRYPQEFRQDVVEVARAREPGVTLAQVAKDFGVSDATLSNWLRQADVDEGRKPGVTKDEAAEIRELRRRNRLPVFDDYVQRMFTADAPNKVWVTDLTEDRTDEGRLYCCAIKDLCGNRIVGYSIGDRMTAALAVRALNNAVARRGDVAGCILHSDRGSQYASQAYRAVLAEHGLKGSMSRRGNPYDCESVGAAWRA